MENRCHPTNNWPAAAKTEDCKRFDLRHSAGDPRLRFIKFDLE